MKFKTGDRVRIDISDKDDPDFNYHRERGEVIEIIEDAAGKETGDERDSNIYRVETGDGEVIDLRWRDLRPVNTG